MCDLKNLLLTITIPALFSLLFFYYYFFSSYASSFMYVVGGRFFPFLFDDKTKRDLVKPFSDTLDTIGKETGLPDDQLNQLVENLPFSFYRHERSPFLGCFEERNAEEIRLNMKDSLRDEGWDDSYMKHVDLAFLQEQTMIARSGFKFEKQGGKPGTLQNARDAFRLFYIDTKMIGPTRRCMVMTKTKISFRMDTERIDKYDTREYLWGLYRTQSHVESEIRERALTVGHQKQLESIFSYEAMREAKSFFDSQLPPESVKSVPSQNVDYDEEL